MHSVPKREDETGFIRQSFDLLKQEANFMVIYWLSWMYSDLQGIGWKNQQSTLSMSSKEIPAKPKLIGNLRAIILIVASKIYWLALFSGSSNKIWMPQRPRQPPKQFHCRLLGPLLFRWIYQPRWEYSPNGTGLSCRGFLQCSHERHLRSLESCDKQHWFSPLDWTDQPAGCRTSFQTNGSKFLRMITNLLQTTAFTWIFVRILSFHACLRISACVAIQTSVIQMKWLNIARTYLP